MGPVRVQVDRRRVHVDDREVALTATEFALLAHLMRAPARVFTREQLLGAVWGYTAAAGTRTVDVHVAQLRAKLGAGEPDPHGARHRLRRGVVVTGAAGPPPVGAAVPAVGGPCAAVHAGIGRRRGRPDAGAPPSAGPAVPAVRGRRRPVRGRHPDPRRRSPCPGRRPPGVGAPDVARRPDHRGVPAGRGRRRGCRRAGRRAAGGGHRPDGHPGGARPAGRRRRRAARRDRRRAARRRRDAPGRRRARRPGRHRGGRDGARAPQRRDPRARCSSRRTCGGCSTGSRCPRRRRRRGCATWSRPGPRPSAGSRWSAPPRPARSAAASSAATSPSPCWPGSRWPWSSGWWSGSCWRGRCAGPRSPPACCAPAGGTCGCPSPGPPRCRTSPVR